MKKTKETSNADDIIWLVKSAIKGAKEDNKRYAKMKFPKTAFSIKELWSFKCVAGQLWALHIKDPIEGKAPFVVYYIEDFGNHLFECVDAESAIALAKEMRQDFARGNERTKYDLAARHVVCGFINEAWFMANDKDRIFGDFVIPKGATMDDAEFPTGKKVRYTNLVPKKWSVTTEVLCISREKDGSYFLRFTNGYYYHSKENKKDVLITAV